MGLKFQTRLKPSFSLIDLTPLVDVIFLLLIFFIVTSDILPLKSLKIENPILERDARALTTQLLVVLDAQHVIYVGSKKSIADLATLEELVRTELHKMHGSKEAKPTIVLSVDRRVEYGSFLRLFSTLQKIGYPIRLVFKSEN
jgi:biopolymer transport protein ExbD